MKIGLCLSGGGVKGAAHIGVLKALEEEKIKIDCISGTSSGSIVAAMYAMGYNPDEILKMFIEYGKEISNISFKTIFKLIFGLVVNRKIAIEGLNEGHKLADIIQNQAERKGIKKIKDIEMPLIIPSVNLDDGSTYLFTSLQTYNRYSDDYIIDNTIEIGKAIQSSCAYPGVFCPVKYNNKKLIDGGVRENTPWKELKAIGTDKIISVVFEKEKEIKKEINMLDCITDSMGILMHELYTYEIEGIDYILKVKTKSISLLDVDKIQELYTQGYKVAKRHMNNIKEYLHRK